MLSASPPYTKIAVVIIVVSVMLGYIFLAPKTPKKIFRLNPQASTENNNPTDTVILSVGKEKIYQKDYDTELMYYPDKNNPAVRKMLLDKLVTESIILQAGKKEGIIPLDATVFNNPNKDYLKRIKFVEQVKRGIDQEADTIEGTIVSIWFYNNDWTGPVGYDEAKKIVLEKISALYNQVKTKKITIDQAGEIIKNDTSLASIDKAYQNNAIAHFSVHPDEPISLSQEYDQKLRKLQSGELSEIYLASIKEDETKKIRDAVYLFGMVTKRKANPTIRNFDSWYAKNKISYEIIYY
jgi:hypothetical protein